MRHAIGLAVALAAGMAGCTDECFIDGAGCSHDAFAYRAVAAGTHHTCALRLDGGIVCWGRNDLGQASPPNGSYDRVFAGEDFSCALRYSGELACWGDPAVVSGALARTRDLAVGRRHACGLSMADLRVRCWGENSFGQLDVPATLDPETTGSVQFGSGRDFTCARSELEGPYQCWGRDDAGQLAIPSAVELAIAGADRFGCGIGIGASDMMCWGEAPSGAPPADFASQLSAGATHICALSPQGGIACWGDATGGKTAAPSGRYDAISAGAAHTCAITHAGNAVCWGDDADGQSSPPTE